MDGRVIQWPPSQLAENASCVAAGFDPALTEFRKGLLLPNRYNASSDAEVFAPIYASNDLTGDPVAGVTGAVIFVHGLAGDANTYFCDGVQSTRVAGVAASVLSVAPWFGNEQVLAGDWLTKSKPTRKSTPRTAIEDDAVSAHWTTSRWLDGGDASPSPKRYTTSFDVLDAVVNALIRTRESGRFPNLRNISINGFSAGAQLVSRWAVFSPIDTIRVIVADGSSYLYLDDTRPAASCTPMHDTGVNHSCAAFATPSEARIGDCDEWNDYKYGIDNLADLSTNVYVAKIVDGGPAALKATVDRFLQKDLRFIIGDQDICNCRATGYANSKQYCFPAGTACAPTVYPGCCDTYPDTTTDNAMSVACSAMLEGSNRLQRALNYCDYLSRLSGQGSAWPRRDFFVGGHNNSAFYASAAFNRWAFGLPSRRNGGE